MKTRLPRFASLLMLVICWMGSPVINARALTVGDLAGTWRVVMFSTPSTVTMSKDGQNRITSINQGSRFEYGSGRVTFAANGTLTGTFTSDGESPESLTGNISVTGQGKIAVTIDGDDEGPIVASINAGLDFMASFESQGDVHDVLFFLKEPAAVSAADLAGNWTGFGFETPSQIQSLPVGQPATSVSGLDKFSAFPANLTVTVGGALFGSLDGTFGGNFSGYANGDLSLTIDPSEEDPFTQSMFINASKTIMLQVVHHDDFDSNELIVFVRQPASAPATGDIVGHWHIGFLTTPSVITPVVNGGFVTELNGRFNFEVVSEKLTAGTDNFFTAQFAEGPETGAITSVSTAGDVELFFNQNVETVTLRISATLDVMFALSDDTDHQEFIFMMKSPPSSANTEEAGLVSIKNGSFLDIYWAAGPGRFLQESPDLVTWTTVSGTAGEHSYNASLTGQKFYRVATTPD